MAHLFYLIFLASTYQGRGCFNGRRPSLLRVGCNGGWIFGLTYQGRGCFNGRRPSLLRVGCNGRWIFGGRYVSGAWLLQRSETVVPMRGLQREVDFGTYVYCRHGSNDAGRNLRQNVFFILFHLSAMILITATMSLISTFLSVLTSAVAR